MVEELPFPSEFEQKQGDIVLFLDPDGNKGMDLRSFHLLIQHILGSFPDFRKTEYLKALIHFGEDGIILVRQIAGFVLEFLIKKKTRLIRAQKNDEIGFEEIT